VILGIIFPPNHVYPRHLKNISLLIKYKHLMGFDRARAVELFAYGLGNVTGLVTGLSPVSAMTVTGIKTGARIGRSFKSFGKGGWYNPGFYANCLSAGCSGASLTFQGIAYVTSSACPPIALPLFAASQACSAAADVVDSTFSIATFF
jgi:hypothetical protein